ncbi:TetR/AcrR family transcriptional regulator [Labrys monachus]|uniref:AcrR family transcriptional regulator n=1 Tax=Labrys monachus TaxID=217067 RepID=A0ABU0FKB0_9HYPH|nr:TetR/AcrR family transcriptional regulator [Labrys monachus]MDQ0394518.1 AcrR family transcriptional regulator [Labrys monachus]
MRDGARTRARIETEALRLFADKGVAGTSVRDIAAAVGVAEAALYRHFPSKDALSRHLFLEGYAALAGDIGAVAARQLPLGLVIEEVVAIFCRLFDDNRPLFSFLLLSQHAHLADVPEEADKNIVEAVRAIFAAAMGRGEIPDGEPDLLAALALGIVAQPAIFTIYGRLSGPLGDRAGDLARAVKAVAGIATA